MSKITIIAIGYLIPLIANYFLWRVEFQYRLNRYNLLTNSEIICAIVISILPFINIVMPLKLLFELLKRKIKNKNKDYSLQTLAIKFLKLKR